MLNDILLERLGLPQALVLGHLRIWAVSDGTFCPQPAYFAPDAAESSDADRFGDSGDMQVLPIGCFVIEGLQDRTILVDAGLGPGRHIAKSTDLSDDRTYGVLEGGALVDQLALTGVDAATITDVVITHFHTDHIGWLVDAPFRSDFRIYGSQRDHEHFERLRHEPDRLTRVAQDDIDLAARGLDAVALHRQAGRLTYQDHGEVAPGVRVLPTGGHTPGHLAVELSSGNQKALILGDAFTAPIQFARTTWHSIGETDVPPGDRTRAELTSSLQASGAMAIGSHFPGLTWGTVDRHGRWTPVHGT